MAADHLPEKPAHPRRTLVMMTAAILAGLAAVLASLLNIRVTNYATETTVGQNTAVLHRIDDRFDNYIATLNATANRQEEWAQRLCARQEIIAREVGAARPGWPACLVPVTPMPTTAAAVQKVRHASPQPSQSASSSRPPEPSPRSTPTPSRSPSPSPCVTRPPTPAPTPLPCPTP